MLRLQMLADSGGSNVARSLASQLESISNHSIIRDPVIVQHSRGRPTGGANSTRRNHPSGFEYIQATANKVDFSRKCDMVCDKLQFYLQNHKYADIIGKSQSEGVNLVGFDQ